MTPLVISALIAAASWATWGHPALALLVVVPWAACRTQWQLFLAVLTYHAVALVDMPIGVARFLGIALQTLGDAPRLGLGGLATFAWSALLSATVVLPMFLPMATKKPHLRPYLLLAGVVLTVVPPIGWFSLVSPVQAIGYWFPGTGWLGLVLGGASIVLLGMLGQQFGRLISLRQVLELPLQFPLQNPWQIATGVLVALSVLLLNVLGQFKDLPPIPPGWEAVDTHFGVYSHNDRRKAFARAGAINQAVLDSSAKVLVFPEGAVGEWRSSSAYWLQAAIQKTGTDSGLAWISGAETVTELGDLHELRNGVIVVSAGQVQFLPGRYPMPGSMGWPLGGYLSDRWNVPVALVNGQRVTFSICFEDMLPWAQWQSYWLQPDVHVSMASLWFADGLNANHIQQASLSGWASMFGVPLVRAVNY